MNLAILKKTRRKPTIGDVFAMLPPDGLFLYGRVIDVDVNAGGFPAAALIYIYRTREKQKKNIPGLSPKDLLVSPIMTNRLPWSKGYFEFLEHRPIRPSERLEVHCFYDSVFNQYFDERGNRLSSRVEPVGDYGLHSYRTIDDEISKALGIPLAPD